MKERKVEISHHFLLTTFKFKRHKWKGITGKQEVDKEMEVGFLWQINFQGSWVSLPTASRSVPLLTNFSFTRFPVSSSLNFKAVAKEEIENVLKCEFVKLC